MLITGGTGSIGSAMAEYIGKCTIFSRDEASQVGSKKIGCQYILGDICDYSSILSACQGMRYVFHFAALKHVDICERQPIEAIRVNVFGTMNVINACRETGAKLITMSSDKAINPGNVYGMTKYLSEKMTIEAGFCVIRSGNVLWSSNSVLPIWKKQIEENNCINLTSPDMTRFFIHPSELVKFIFDCKDKNGIFTVPMKSFRLKDIALSFIDRYGKNNAGINITGMRPGERLHEYRDDNISSEDCLTDDLTYIWK